LTGIRGCDDVPKLPLNSTARLLTGFLRFCVLNPADEREIGMEGAFFVPKPPSNWKASELGHLSLHWYSHLMHGFEVIGYRHSDMNVDGIRYKALDIYRQMVESLHLRMEDKERMIKRLSEDRISNNTVVS
jgi:hypothetical protein